jgi:hypothetical protein
MECQNDLARRAMNGPNLIEQRSQLIDLDAKAAKARGLHPLDRLQIRNHLAAAVERIERIEAGTASIGEQFAARGELPALLNNARNVLSTATGTRHAPARPFYALHMPCPTCANTGEATPGVACTDCSTTERALFTAPKPETAPLSSPVRPATSRAGTKYRGKKARR